ncbi:MAG: biofilm PGA synthesis protein PgaB [Candidatus Marinimicrobia bacterium]|nr:biofilm PGA synthesis protein PgaB [Candidatus Neomarinimicrobiota bacterium]
MKKSISLLFILLFFVTACQKKEHNTDNIINVGVFYKYGICPYCITDVIESLKIDKDIEAKTISAADIMSGAMDEMDVIIFPGGSGRSETGSLGELGQQKVIDLVKKQGKGVIGICAGAYVLSETPDYPSLALSAGEAIDIEHDNRGHGIVKFSLTEAGKEIFPELKDREIYYSQYYEGPVLIPAIKSTYKYNELATMLSDVHTVEGAPAGMTTNRPFIIITDVEKGKTASIVGHPECTPGMRWIIPRLVRIVAGKKIILYNKNVVRPEIYSKEILFTQEQLLKQREAYNNLLRSKEEKLKAMQDIVDMYAWSAKKWIPPMVRDKDFDVRLLAAKLIVYMERTDAINDLKAAVENEPNQENKKQLQEQLHLLKNILPL